MVQLSLGEVAGIVSAAGATLIEDAAQGTGASIDGRPLGGAGAYGILSFGRGKGVTGGGGGALLLNGDAAPERFAALNLNLESSPPVPPRLVAATAAQWALSRPSLYAVPASMPFLHLGDTLYRPPHPPGEIAAFSAALAARSLDAEGEEARWRRSNAETLERMIAQSGVDDLRLPSPADVTSRPGYLRLPVLARTPGARERLSRPAARACGVLPSYPRPLSELDGFSNRVRLVDEIPGARTLATGLFTAPVHSQLDERDCSAVASVLMGEANRSAPL